MVNCSWSEAFPMGRSCYLRFEGSDHRPLITYFNNSRTQKKGLFRFNRSLTEKSEVETVVESAWNHAPLDSVIMKLNSCRRGIIKWTKEQNKKANIIIQQKQEALEVALCAGTPDQAAIESLTNTLILAYREEEQFWLQRSRIQWLKSGDRNTGFFHAATRQRRLQNTLSVIEDDDDKEYFNEDQICSVISAYFNNIFSSNGNHDFSRLDSLLSCKVTDEMNQHLTGIPSDSEIREAAFSINGGKAPGPDGFSAKFYHAYWHIIGPDVTRDVRHFFTSGTLHPQQNETHVRLIPKTTGARKVSDYRPIALCNTHYKIIAKILTRRLKPLLPALISKTQSAFVTGRAIGDNVLITHETLHYLRTSEAKKYCSMAVKTDMSKAYDRIEWGFLRAVLDRMGFAQIWIGWIMSCVESVSYSFLINGSPMGSVKPSRGIRQGDPLSPYLFILCTEVLSAMCEKAQQDGSLAGIRVARGSPFINHLLFADDTMFLCRSSAPSVNALLRILRSYEELSGQRINFLKSATTFSAKTPAEVKARVKTTLGIEAEGGLGKYLGLPEHFGRKKRDIFASILDRIRQKAHSWTSRFLSGAGKQVLLRAVLSAMPNYSMSCFKLPVSLCKQIQSLLTRFWWDANPETRKMCWVAWSTLTLAKYAGGLGFRDIETFNDALLAKIGWRLLKDPQSLLGQVLLGKYARNNFFLDCQAPSNASHGWRSVLAGREILLKGLSWAVGSGDKIKIWKDPWLSCEAPMLPIGPPTEADAERTVSDLLCPISNCWDIDKIRSLLPQYEEVIMRIVTSSAPAPDCLVWLPERSGNYSTKTGYGLGMEPHFAAGALSIPFNWNKCIWNIKTSPKIKDFLWKLVRKAIPVSSNLARRGIPAFNCKRCDCVEDDLHVFLLCSIAEQVWEAAPLANKPLSTTPSMADLIAAASNLTVLPPVGLSTPLWPWILWQLWKARNKLCFENKAFSSMEIISKALAHAKEWEKAQELEKPLLAPGVLDHTRNPPRREPRPSSDTVLCNVDAAWDARTLNCGIGGIFSGQEHIPKLVNISASRRFVSSAIMAEAIAIRSAVLYAASSNVKSLMIRSDSQSLVKMLRGRDSSPALFGILFDIYYFSSSFDAISFVYVPRLSNMQADSVAKSALLLLNSSSIRGV
ncbi:uncharacterized protein LOC130495527 [Raphanus sativus]|uniref:Uncharacterized protein LOC130495527 n=1 Tax=Raphanus sativus TaxID=3726 RepID=A0A9W3BUF4_RAPSA|nr:uncharacterized protein LOC130495527 [Raphanus sativus]